MQALAGTAGVPPAQLGFTKRNFRSQLMLENLTHQAGTPALPAQSVPVYGASRLIDHEPSDCLS